MVGHMSHQFKLMTLRASKKKKNPDTLVIDRCNHSSLSSNMRPFSKLAWVCVLYFESIESI